MRIVVVSAHFPPNFSSGGTLVPARIADELARRGHHVAVFAGELLPGQPDLLTRDELTMAGVRVRWVSINGFVGWDDPRNWRNPWLQAEFSRFLREERPDIVHVHTLQGLGGTLLPTAGACGAGVVVTMHDAWWWCARQFLAEADLRPCSVVVDCGVCPCSVDEAWRRARNAELAANLAAADLVLAPSRPMVELLAANGVPESKLALDENAGATSDPVPVTDSVGDPGTVRFVFAGGPNPVKGSQVVLAAAARLAGLPGWTLDLYGVAAPRRRRLRQVTFRPAYRPAEAAAVLRGYDVLLMSSVVVESYSLLTREALAAGLVVVTGDNPGPTEVVRHGENGLVVPRADPEALAAAMRTLITDRRLLDRLRPAAGAVRLRGLDDQVDGLVEHYRRLREEPPAAGSPIQRVVIATGIDGAPLRYRGHLPAEALATQGVHTEIRHYLDPGLAAAAELADAVVLYRVPATPAVLAMIERIRALARPVPVLFDIDDLVVDPQLAPELDPILTAKGADLDLYWQGVRRYRTTLQACDGYLGSTEYLCRRIGELTGLPTYRFANGVGRQLARAADAALRRPRTGGDIRIGYFSGTDTHDEDWAHIEPAVVALLEQRPEVGLWLGGYLEPTPALEPFADRVTRVPFTRWYLLPAILRDIDINLAPLAPGRTFNEAKSAIKWLEAALVATPTIASPSQPFVAAIQDGRTGRLAGTVPEWSAALTELVDDPAARARLGAAARNAALLELSPFRQGVRYLNALTSARNRIAGGARRGAPTPWQPEVVTERPTTVRLEFYGELRIDGKGRPHPEREPRQAFLARYRQAAREMLADHGVLATGRRLLAVGPRLIRQRLGRR